MTAYISRKSSWLRLLASFLPAAGTAALFWVLFSGPRLGPLYDFLLGRRPSPPVSRELLLIDSTAGSVPGGESGDDILDPGAASSLLYTMTELGARSLVIQVPILGLPAGGTMEEAEILYRFEEEFSILGRNIRNLFDAIRTGSVAPGDASAYVEELVGLSEKGKERLVSALVRRDGESIDDLEEAAAFFGSVRQPGDLRVRLIRAAARADTDKRAPAERDEYSRARPDSDGVLRRAAPVLFPPLSGEGAADNAPADDSPDEKPQAEHIIYAALKARYESAEIIFPGSGNTEDAPRNTPGKNLPVLILKGGPQGEDTIIPLDRNGAVLFEPPRNGDDFRRIGISDFLAYDEADRQLRRLLAEGDALGIYQNIEGENHPGILYDFVLSLREESVSVPPGAENSADEERKRAWIESRRNYFASLDDFLHGPAEINLVNGYEEIIASEALDENGIARITEMRDSLIRIFSDLRNKYDEVLELRNKLESALSGSFCILGRNSPLPSPRAENSGSGFSLFRDFPRGIVRAAESLLYRPVFTDAEASALLANSILTGRAVKPGGDIQLLAASLLSVFLICFLIKSLNPAFTLGAGALLIFLTGAGFSLYFVFSGVWLPPLVPAGAGAAGVLASYIWALAAKARYSGRFRLAYGPFVSRACLKSVIRAGAPLPSRSVTARAAVVAVKNSALTVKIDAAGKNTSVPEALAFQEKVSEIFTNAGGTVIGTEGDMVCACFGSPLERVFLRGKKEASPYEDNIHAKTAPAARAVDFVSEIAGRPECESWNFGLDTGNCAFAWTARSGYFAQGTPVQKARVLARLAARHRTRVVISSPVNEALPDLAVKKLDAFKEAGGAPGEAFYRLTVRDKSP